MYVFEQRVRELLEEKGIYAKVMLSNLQINKNQLKKWSNTGTLPKRIVLEAIADYLDTTPEYLIGTTDKKEIPIKQIISDGLSDKQAKMVRLTKDFSDGEFAILFYCIDRLVSKRTL